MKTVIFDHPRIASHEMFNDIANTPLWSCLMGGYVAAALEDAGADVIYLDHAQPRANFDSSMEVILELAPELLAVNAVYFWEQTDRLFLFFQQLREKGFTGHLNLFGFFPSFVYPQILEQYKAVDSVAVGECEHALAELWQTLSTSGLPKKIAGLAVRNESGAVEFVSRKVEKNPDNFPFPKRVLEGSTTISILASRGCYNRCSFCLVPAFDELHGGWRGRSPENIVEEVSLLREQGYRDFYFLDPNFVAPGREGRARTLRLLELLKEQKISFGMETRPNDLDDEIMAALVEAGLTSLLMGVESGSAIQLQKMKKHSSVTTASEAIALCRKYGIDPEIGFLMFLPDATFKDLADNFRFLKENDLLSRLDRTANLLCHRQIVLRGTSGYDEHRAQGRLEGRGIFDFEGIVPFRDERIADFADKVIFACHTILRSTAEPQSPIFWQTPNPECSAQLNMYLVDLFADSLQSCSINIKGREEIREDINHIIARYPSMVVVS